VTADILMTGDMGKEHIEALIEVFCIGKTRIIAMSLLVSYKCLMQV